MLRWKSMKKRFSADNQFLSLNPCHVLVLVNKGRALARLRKYDEAIECFDEVLKSSPGTQMLYSIKGWRMPRWKSMKKRFSVTINSLKSIQSMCSCS